MQKYFVQIWHQSIRIILRIVSVYAVLEVLRCIVIVDKIIL